MLIQPEFYARRLKDCLTAYDKARTTVERQRETAGSANPTAERSMGARKREVDRASIPAQLSIWADANLTFDPRGKITSTDLRNCYEASDGGVPCSAKTFHRYMTELGYTSAHGGGPKIWRVACNQAIPDRMDCVVTALESDHLSKDRYLASIKIQSSRSDCQEYDLLFQNLESPEWDKLPAAVTRLLWPIRQANFLLGRALKRFLASNPTSL